MADREGEVYLNTSTQDVFVGRLWGHFRKGKESASLQYDKTYLQWSSALCFRTCFALARRRLSYELFSISLW